VDLEGHDSRVRRHRYEGSERKNGAGREIWNIIIYIAFLLSEIQNQIQYCGFYSSFSSSFSWNLTASKEHFATSNGVIAFQSVITSPDSITVILSGQLNARLCSRDDRLCGLVVRVLGYRSGGPGSIPGTTRKKK
jgi:hypothetical protein